MDWTAIVQGPEKVAEPGLDAEGKDGPTEGAERAGRYLTAGGLERLSRLVAKGRAAVAGEARTSCSVEHGARSEEELGRVRAAVEAAVEEVVGLLGRGLVNRSNGTEVCMMHLASVLSPDCAP